MADVVPFPAQSTGLAIAPRFIVRAKALQDIACLLASVARDLGEEVSDLINGDRPTPDDHSMNGKMAAELGEAMRLLLLANGLPLRDEAFAAALNRWLSREHGR